MAERLRILVSVRSVAEALVAAEAGVDFVDLKEPNGGALGGLGVAVIDRIVRALAERPSATPRKISATIGDLTAADTLGAMLTRVHAVAACGVDYVKVGIAPDATAEPRLHALAASGSPVVPVFIADRGLDLERVAGACALGFPGVMADTQDKRAGTLFDAVDDDSLRAFVAVARRSGTLVGLAGALRMNDTGRVAALGADYAGFRSAVCLGDRTAALDPALLRNLLDAAPRGDAVKQRSSEAVKP